mgnify:CR=1 FL=1
MSRYPVGIPPGTALLRVERVDNAWLLWLHANHDYSLGTYLKLGDDGSITNVTERPNEVAEFVVKPKD